MLARATTLRIVCLRSGVKTGAGWYSAPVNHLEGLNDAQKEAVLSAEGPLLIIAGAGAGKTKTITHRIAHLVASGVPGRHILAVTFTNKAAGEMRERALALLTPESREQGGAPLVCTFHALGVRVLREFASVAGLPRGFSIWDRDDSARSVKRALEALGADSYTPRQVLSRISREKGKGLSPREFASAAETPFERIVGMAWERYEKSLAEEGALDFDDLLVRTLALLKESADVRNHLQDRWRYITIDEYQDTNAIQYEIAALLAGERKNMCAVGDGDQNIYSWRGADMTHLLAFEMAFPGTKVVLLEQNYRSTETILSAANAVIEKNTKRHKKRLFSDRGMGEPIRFYQALDESDEARYIARTIRGLLGSGTKASEIAVLYRENFQSRAVEEALIRSGIPYRIAGTRFFERKEVKDTLSYLRAAGNPKSGNDISRIASVPPRGIGKQTLEKMLKGLDAELAPAARAKVATFRSLLLNIGRALSERPASEAVRYAVSASGIEALLLKDKDEGEERLENVRELIALASQYDSLTPPEGIERLLEEAALMADQDSLAEKAEAVSLMTVHASKGLEFDAVFVTGLEQGLFPSGKGDGDRDPEEERRLFYVALTRARSDLFLTSATTRARYGSRDYSLPSEFLDDIDGRLIEHEREAFTPRKGGGILDDYEIL